MEDEDGTCLLDVLCDPQALNDFLHGTNELQNEDLLISSTSVEPLFADAPSPVSLLADDSLSQDTPPPVCVDLSFLEEALLASPEGRAEPSVGQGEPAAGAGCEEEEEEEEEMACDILQQSLQEADITEQTMALEAGLAPPGDGVSLYAPGPHLSPPAAPFLSKAVTFPIAPALPRDTQAAVEPPHPSLLAVGPGCPSLKPAAPQLMGLLPGNVFPAPSPETSFALSPAQGSSMLIQKAVPSLTGRPLIAPTLRATTAPGILLQRGPLPIQPKLPISIQPRLVQISPKPPGQKTSPGLTFVPGTASPNILLSPPPGPKPAPQSQPASQLPKPVSLQLVNQGGSFVIQPQGLFQGQSQFLLPSQSPVTISQPAGAARPMLTTSHQGPSVQGVAPSTGHLVDGSQILTVPHRHLNFSPVFTTPSGQLTLRQGTVLSGSLQLQSAPPTVFQMPAQLAGAYAPQGQGQRATLVHSPALGNHITLINSSGMLTPDLTSISIVNGPPVVQGLPFAPQTQRPLGGVTEGQLNLQQASVVLLPERPVLEERGIPEEQYQHLPQTNRHLLQHACLQSSAAGLQSPSPPIVTLLQAPQDTPLAPDPPATVTLPKHPMPQTDMKLVVEEVHNPIDQSQAFMHHLQQQALISPRVPSDVLIGTLPVVAVEPQASPAANEREDPPPVEPVLGEAGALSVTTDPCELTPRLGSDTEDPVLLCSPALAQALEITPPASLSPPPGGAPPAPSEPGDTAPGPPQFQTAMAYSSPSPLSVGVSVPQDHPDPIAVCVGPTGGPGQVGQQHTQSKPTAALAMEGKAFTLDVHPPSPAPQGHQAPRPQAHRQQIQGQGPHTLTAQQPGMKVAGPVEVLIEERLTAAMRRHRVQQQLCADHSAVQNPATCAPFSTLEAAVRHLLPYHTCTGQVPTQADFSLVDEQFDTVSGFLLNRTKDMVNKYRQLLVGEAQQVSPSAEMVMLERLFLQAERLALGEDRRRARRDPESFLMALRTTSASSPHRAYTSSSRAGHAGSPPSPPAWMRLSNRPPGLRTYRSSTKGALRLTIKHESGSRKVVHNSACDSTIRSAPSGHKRDHTGQITNGGSVVEEQMQGTNGAPCPLLGEEISNGALPSKAAEEALCVVDRAAEAKTALDPQMSPNALSTPELQASCLELPPPDHVSAPKLKRYRPEPPQAEWPSPPPTLLEDSMLSEHLQSAIDSILELQRLQGPSAALPCGQPGAALDQAVASILEGHL